MSTRIKICGLRDAETIRAMDGLPIHEVGFVFAKSRRQVTAEAAVELIRAARSLRCADGMPPRTVGVFVDPEPEALRDVLRAAPLDIVQLHGSETPEYCRRIRSELGVRVWKVFAIRGGDAPAAERIAPYAGAIDAALIDTAGGGTGSVFDWRLVTDYKAAAGAIGVPLYVAGGLNERNVRELIDAHEPDGVDVSSGVETDGVKDPVKIRSFVGRVAEG
ncbi:MAG: N-(5'-phosphoribosyl)anthranilate isomerase [Thermobacillus sp.]|uniref:phosphoribosylanthranilate isomerase n=1 Tax=Thermobacillus sp. TaxID=2108467 RepID=UPI000E382343|nr:phosphoribosylanthranilate isomerase [Thermobacillus sp.]REK59207.1 MAG: N-(5'-phosphoribosyl)anthranilate isomerase [Thermobacillus sp.]